MVCKAKVFHQHSKFNSWIHATSCQVFISVRVEGDQWESESVVEKLAKTSQGMSMNVKEVWDVGQQEVKV